MWLDKFIPMIVTRRWMKETERRIHDLEEHFVTKRDPTTGAPVETLADVPVSNREAMRKKLSLRGNLALRGLTWQQRKQILEATDGGRKTA